MSSEPFVISYSSGSGSAKITWRSPCNIELVKHFGKREHHLPANPSLSITLTNAYTETSVEYEFIEAIATPGIHFLFEGNDDPSLAKCISEFIENAAFDIPVLSHLKININSKNSFQYSAGIFSLASVFSSIALCLCAIEEKINGSITGPMDFYRKASFLARLGSGSACRSVYGGYVVWGDSDEYNVFSNLYAHPFPHEVHPIFQKMEDTILVVSSENKKLTDFDKNAMMNNHLYATCRFEQARHNMSTLLRALQAGDTDTFVKIIENEALSLHALIISSPENCILFKPESIAIIEKIRVFRQETRIPVCFTLDADPNIHLLYPGVYKDYITSFIQNELPSYCEDKKVWNDFIGKGPEQI